MTLSSALAMLMTFFNIRLRLLGSHPESSVVAFAAGSALAVVHAPRVFVSNNRPVKVLLSVRWRAFRQHGGLFARSAGLQVHRNGRLRSRSKALLRRTGRCHTKVPNRLWSGNQNRHHGINEHCLAGYTMPAWYYFLLRGTSQVARASARRSLGNTDADQTIAHLRGSDRQQGKRDSDGFC